MMHFEEDFFFFLVMNCTFYPSSFQSMFCEEITRILIESYESGD
jgi:hypothetical protein